MLSTEGSPRIEDTSEDTGADSKEDAHQPNNPSPALTRAPPANYLGGWSSSSMPRRKLAHPRTPSNPRCGSPASGYPAPSGSSHRPLNSLSSRASAAAAAAAAAAAVATALRGRSLRWVTRRPSPASSLRAPIPPDCSSPVIPPRKLSQDTASTLLQRALEDSAHLEQVPMMPGWEVVLRGWWCSGVAAAAAADSGVSRGGLTDGHPDPSGESCAYF